MSLSGHNSAKFMPFPVFTAFLGSTIGDHFRARFVVGL
jgi:hypothetical protein